MFYRLIFHCVQLSYRLEVSQITIEMFIQEQLYLYFSGLY